MSARATDDLDLDLLHETLGTGPRRARPTAPVHPLADGHRSVAAGFAIDVSDYPDINELMLVGDVLVTTTRRDLRVRAAHPPDGFFAPDYEAYERERGFYFDYRTGVPGPSTRPPPLAVPSGGVFDIDRVERFRDESFDVADGHSATYVTDELILPSLTRAGEGS